MWHYKPPNAISTATGNSMSVFQVDFHPEELLMLSYHGNNQSSRLCVWDLQQRIDSQFHQLHCAEWPVERPGNGGKPFACFYRRSTLIDDDESGVDEETTYNQYAVLAVESSGARVHHQWNAHTNRLDKRWIERLNDDGGAGSSAVTASVSVNTVICRRPANSADLLSVASLSRQSASVLIHQRPILGVPVLPAAVSPEEFTFPIVHSAPSNLARLPKTVQDSNSSYTDQKQLVGIASQLNIGSNDAASNRDGRGVRSKTPSSSTAAIKQRPAASSSYSTSASPAAPSKPTMIPHASGDSVLCLDLDHFITGATLISSSVTQQGPRDFVFDDPPLPTKQSPAETVPLTFQRIMEGRLEALRRIRECWSDANANPSLELLCSLRDPAVLVDLLRVINKRPRMFNLDSCILLFHAIPSLLFDGPQLFEE